MNIQEERLVAKLEMLGVRYLSRQVEMPVGPVNKPERFLADLLIQPSSRVRMAFIAALLARPALARAAPAALARLKSEEWLVFKLFYTAAVILQQVHTEELISFLGDRWEWLPDLYSIDLGLDTSLPSAERLTALGNIHRQQTGIVANWAGSYENVAHQLIHRWEKEQQWNQ